MTRDHAPHALGDFQEALRSTLTYSRRYSVDEIVDRAAPVVELAVQYGTTHVRAFADVGPVEGLIPVQAMLSLRERYRDIVTLEVTAFPQAGMAMHDGGPALLAEAMALGADVVGGIPWIEPTNDLARSHVDTCFDLANSLAKPLHFLVDETDDPDSRTLEMVIERALTTPIAAGVTVSHATSMASWSSEDAQRILRRAQQADLHFCCNAHENLMLMGGSDEEPARRGIMRVREMQALGINILSAQDSVVDPYYPFGRMNQLEVAWILGHAIRAQSVDDVEFLYDAISTNAARALQLSDYGCNVGDHANLVIIGQRSVRDAIRFMGPVIYTVKDGRITSDRGTIIRGG